ncbi:MULTISPECIES: hypothetical protein [Gordonia]|uniref:Uncharacterized protein n=1 Tax=Gordonia sihwensis NBRC 108236 TaxID=1223544 RepID=L7LPX7_9ACTN|nr:MULTISPECIES: hypothetical protein [Gordonia]AUH68533.1 hypothetical protein CXX93_09415 [Gordonia sp. YC-JH1]GAC62202.1 hypothetical protein GSI01S_30_00100 [Gordonia sihwensis NBRC 108236]
MTIIQDRIEDIAGAEFAQAVTFTIPRIRESASGAAIVTEQKHRFQVTDGGDLVTSNLDPGPATVRIGLNSYQITIPDSSSPIRLWPLIDAGMPAPPPSEQYQFVRNGGGLVRAQAVDLDEYESMMWDPGTLYIIKDAQVTE